MVEKGPVALKILLEAARSNSGIRRRRPWSKQGLLRRRMPVFAAPLASRQDRQEVAGPVACSRLRCRLRFRFGFLHPHLPAHLDARMQSPIGRGREQCYPYGPERAPPRSRSLQLLQ